MKQRKHAHGMKPIWYFVGLILFWMGTVVLVAGLVEYFHPPAVRTTLADLHPNIWWGAVMMAVGAVFHAANRRK